METFGILIPHRSLKGTFYGSVKGTLIDAIRRNAYQSLNEPRAVGK